MRIAGLDIAEPFDPGCIRCPRLATHLDNFRARHPDHHAAPVAAFGAARAPLLIVGLAPGAHGANRTGRPFTRDASARFLFAALHWHGFASHAESIGPGDGMRLLGARITNAVRCLPPANRPSASEVAACQPFLAAEIRSLLRVPGNRCLLTLGRIAHESVADLFGARRSEWPFVHAAHYAQSPRMHVVASYHPSAQNVNTGRLTAPMFDTVLSLIRRLLDG